MQELPPQPGHHDDVPDREESPGTIQSLIQYAAHTTFVKQSTIRYEVKELLSKAVKTNCLQ
jgi:hypothetical protein